MLSTRLAARWSSLLLVAALLLSSAVARADFTFVVIPDTQAYVHTPALQWIFDDQTQWIVDNKASLNIEFAIHVGDIVDRDENTWEWDAGKASLAILDDPDPSRAVPYSVLPGNHDLHDGYFPDPDPGYAEYYDSIAYNTHFPASEFVGRSYWGGSFEGNDNSYQTIHVDSYDFLFISLRMAPSDAAIAWANDVLANHPAEEGWRAIVATHAYLDSTGVRFDYDQYTNISDDNNGEDIWQKLVRSNRQIFMVVNGHWCLHGSARQISQNDFGDPVHEIFVNFQCEENGGNGYLRYFTFKPEEDRIYAYTYSTTLDAFFEDEPGIEEKYQSEFVLDYDLSQQSAGGGGIGGAGAGGGGATAGSGPGGSAGGTGAGAPVLPGDSAGGEDDGGCGCRSHPSRQGGGIGFLVLAAPLVLRRRGRGS